MRQSACTSGAGAAARWRLLEQVSCGLRSPRAVPRRPAEAKGAPRAPVVEQLAGAGGVRAHLAHPASADPRLHQEIPARATSSPGALRASVVQRAASLTSPAASADAAATAPAADRPPARRRTGRAIPRPRPAARGRELERALREQPGGALDVAPSIACPIARPGSPFAAYQALARRCSIVSRPGRGGAAPREAPWRTARGSGTQCRGGRAHQHDVRARQPRQHVGRVPRDRAGHRTPGREPVEHARAGHELELRRRQPGEHLLPHVAGHEPVVARERGRSEPRTSAARARTGRRGGARRASPRCGAEGRARAPVRARARRGSEARSPPISSWRVRRREARSSRRAPRSRARRRPPSLREARASWSPCPPARAIAVTTARASEQITSRSSSTSTVGLARAQMPREPPQRHRRAIAATRRQRLEDLPADRLHGVERQRNGRE